MDLIEKKNLNDYNETQKELIKIFKFRDNNEIKIKGSSSFKIFVNYADYDLYTVIRYKYSVKEIFDEFKKILNTILEHKNIYFEEFKIEQINGLKFKWFPNDLFKFSDFKKAFVNVDFVKIDVILFYDNKFKNASCNYIFNKYDDSKEEKIKELKKNINILKKDNNYFKILKKLYIYYVLNGDNGKVDGLTNIFNDVYYGKLYVDLDNIEVIDKLKKLYNDPLTKKRIETNLNDIKFYQNYENQYKKSKKILNDMAKNEYEKYKIK